MSSFTMHDPSMMYILRPEYLNFHASLLPLSEGTDATRRTTVAWETYHRLIYPLDID